MKEFIQTLLKILFMGVVLGCQPNNKGVVLEQAEACMEANPDSASRMLEKWDVSAFDSDCQMAKFALLWTQARHKCHLPLENDSLINVAVTYFVRHNNAPYAAKSFLYKGLVHKQRKEVKKAAEAFALSEQWFEGVEDDQYKALLYNHYGDLMLGEENFPDALRYLKKSYHFKLKGDSVHYILSACSAIANVCIYMGQPDSAQAYFERGLAYRERVAAHNFYMFQQSYANFLRKNKIYVQAEQMLLECERHITGRQKYSVYSSLATLYCDMKEYEKALGYAAKVLDSGDSVLQRGGFLNLYRIHRHQGNISESQRFHDLYREYDNDISMRLKTIEVAAIPHKVKAETLQMVNERGRRNQWMLAVGLLGVMLAGVFFYVYVKRLHDRQQQALQCQLAEDEREIKDMALAQSERKKEIKLLHYQIERKKKQMENMAKRQKERLQKEQDKLKDKVKEISDLREKESEMERENSELKREKEKMDRANRRLQTVADKSMHDEQMEKWIIRYMQDHMGHKDYQSNVALLMQLKHGHMYVGNPVSDDRIVPMLTALLDEASPGMRQRIEEQTNNTTKQVMCYLIALGLDDLEMMFRATGKRLETIEKYHKECRDLVDGLLLSGRSPEGIGDC